MPARRGDADIHYLKPGDSARRRPCSSRPTASAKGAWNLQLSNFWMESLDYASCVITSTSTRRPRTTSRTAGCRS
ncbi:MAG: hypothetical protein R3E53_01845 [Myxococcota bacterium]